MTSHYGRSSIDHKPNPKVPIHRPWKMSAMTAKRLRRELIPWSTPNRLFNAFILSDT